jgi:hypothetical protein
MHQLAEALGALVVVAGCAFMVAACAAVSTALALGVAGFFLVAGGFTGIYLASVLEARAKAPTPKPGDRP